MRPALLIFGLALASARVGANQEEWRIKPNTGVPIDAVALEWGTSAPASDGYDAGDGLAYAWMVEWGGLFARHEYGASWSGPTGFYFRDVRAPLGLERPALTWGDLYMWSGWPGAQYITLPYEPGYLGGGLRPAGPIPSTLTMCLRG